MGIRSGKKISSFLKRGWFAVLFSIVVLLFNGIVVALISTTFIESIGNRFLLAILAASASYIAVKEGIRLVAPKANPGLYVPMALAITFPFNIITIGLTLYLYLVQIFN